MFEREALSKFEWLIMNDKFYDNIKKLSFKKSWNYTPKRSNEILM